MNGEEPFTFRFDVGLCASPGIRTTEKRKTAWIYRSRNYIPTERKTGRGKGRIASQLSFHILTELHERGRKGKRKRAILMGPRIISKSPPPQRRTWPYRCVAKVECLF
jgi:hypothetical protein